MNARLARTRRRGATVVLIVEAVILLPIIGVAIRLLRLHTLRHLLDFAPPSNRGASRAAANRVGAAVIAVAERLPFVTCLSTVIVRQLDDLDEYVVLVAPNW